MAGAVKSNLDPEMERVAQSLVDAIEAGDIDTWLSIFSSDAMIWHSNDNAEMIPKTNADILRGMFAGMVTDFQYLDVRRHQFDGGYVQEHILSMKAKTTGAVYQGPVCMVIRVADGHVVRFHEYIDSNIQTFAQENAPAR